MQLVRNVLRDLVEKRLWPIALGLLVLLVAVPVMLGGGGGDVPEPASPATPASAAADTSAGERDGVVTVADSSVQQRSRGGRIRDPFVQPKAKAASTSTGSSATTPPPTTATGAGPVHVGGGTPPSGGGGGVDISPLPPLGGGSTGPGGGGSDNADTSPDRADVYRVTLRFGKPDGKLKSYDDLARLTPLPSIEDPFFVFLGVLEDGQTATFLVDSTATPNGDGKCRPSKRDCETIELKAGDTEFFDMVDANGKQVQYQLDLKKIRRVGVVATKASAAYARHSLAGQELVRTAMVSEGNKALRAYHYRPGDGLLVRAKREGGARAAAGEAPYRWAKGEVSLFRTRPHSGR